MDVTMSGMGQASSQGQQDKSDHSQNGEEQNAGDVPIYYHCAPGSSYFEDEMYMREVGDIVDSFYPSVASPAISIPDEEVPDEERPNEAIPDEVTPPGQEANSQTQSDTPPEFLDGAPGPSVTLDPTPSPDASSPPPEPLHDEPSSSTTSTTASTPEEVTLGSPEENPPTNSNSLPESSESASESAVTSDPTPPPGSNPPPPEPLVDEPSSSPSPTTSSTPEELTPGRPEENPLAQSNSPTESSDFTLGPSIASEPTATQDFSSPPPEPVLDDSSSPTTTSTPDKVTSNMPEGIIPTRLYTRPFRYFRPHPTPRF